MKLLTGEWLKSADSDIKTINEIIENPELTHIVAFHAHQCVEKCFKAVLEEYRSKVDKIHDLLKLYKEIKKILDIELNEDKLELLNKLYIDARYPSDLGLLPGGKLTLEDAREFYKFAEEVFHKIKEILEK